MYSSLHASINWYTFAHTRTRLSGTTSSHDFQMLSGEGIEDSMLPADIPILESEVVDFETFE